MPDMFLDAIHPISRRRVILEDDGRTGWLYMTAPDASRPVADVWVYNRMSPPAAVDRLDRSRPPPIVVRLAGPGSVVPDPGKRTWEFRWTADGDTVALQCDGAIVAILSAANRRGRTANVTADGPWGSPLRPEDLQQPA